MEVAYNNYLQIYFLRLGKDYKIIEVDSEILDRLFLKEKYTFYQEVDNEDSKDSKFVAMDLIGPYICVDEPKEYTKTTGDVRKVTRMKMYYNKKVIVVSFWGENASVLENELLVTSEPIILTDVIKKGEFFEFNGDSTLVRLNSDPSIYERNPNFKALIEVPALPLDSDPQIVETRSIRECKSIEYGRDNREVVYTQ